MIKLVFLALIMAKFHYANAHGRLLVPPARSSAWREDPVRFPTNYDDNQMFCGGFYTQWTLNNGKCGICGEEYGKEQYTKGGTLYRGYSVRTYTSGQSITVQVELTANHLGYFEFRLCNTDTLNGQDATQSCLDKTVLSDKLGRKQFFIGTRLGKVNIQLVLPRGLVCQHCVLQWKYNAGNSWNIDPITKKGCIGCGPQEQFYGCSDIAIKSSFKRGKYDEDEWDKKALVVEQDASVSVPVSVLKRLISEIKRLKEEMASSSSSKLEASEDEIQESSRREAAALVAEQFQEEQFESKRDSFIYSPSSLAVEDLNIRRR